ncbi:MAG: YtxH domain-containing protein [Paludibacter sp.]|nr:YtxH domain-containing protein [Paludibacter sp.]
MKNSVGIIAAFLGGAVVGGILGVLFAPESGEETRKKIVDALEKRGIKLSRDEMDDLVDEIKSQVNAEQK